MTSPNRWRVYYADDSVFTSDEGEPHEAPRHGVQFVAIQDPEVGWQGEQSPEGYWIWRNGRWFGTDTMGFWDYLYHHRGPCVCLFGRTLTRPRYRTLLKRATKDLGEKSAWAKREDRDAR